MEIIKKELENNVLKILIGNEINKESNELVGTVELDIESQAEFVEYINNTLDDGFTKILLSLENISYIDSSGLWALFESHKKTEQRNGRMVLLKPRNDVKRVLDITKISTKIKIEDDESDALTHLKSE